MIFFNEKSCQCITGDIANKNMKTAAEWLEDNLLSEPWAEEHFKHNSECWDKAKEMEKEQIINACKQCSYKSNRMRNIKFKLHKIVGKWVNDDIDIIPSIKLRTGSKSNETTSVTTTMVCLAWLKWAIGISVSKITFKSE